MKTPLKSCEKISANTFKAANYSELILETNKKENQDITIQCYKNGEIVQNFKIVGECERIMRERKREIRRTLNLVSNHTLGDFALLPDSTNCPQYIPLDIFFSSYYDYYLIIIQEGTLFYR
jgi:hypothetical protein